MVYFLLGSYCIHSDDINKLYFMIGLCSGLTLTILLTLMYYQTHFTNIMWMILGFFLCPNLLVWYWYSVEIAFPLKETTFSCVFLIMANFIGLVFSFGSRMLMKYAMTGKDGPTTVIVFCIFIWILGALTSLCMKKIDHSKIENIRNTVSVSFDNKSAYSDYSRF